MGLIPRKTRKRWPDVPASVLQTWAEHWDVPPNLLRLMIACLGLAGSALGVAIAALALCA